MEDAAYSRGYKIEGEEEYNVCSIARRRGGEKEYPTLCPLSCDGARIVLIVLYLATTPLPLSQR